MASETIAAIATAPGAGGVGVIRLSGDAAIAIGRALTGINPRPRHAHYAGFRGADGAILDRGLLLAFPAPASYTGEDVCELHAHGSRPLLELLLARCCALGARLAHPGEFTERAFRNGKLDLAQAEAVADLIAARSTRAARAAGRSLAGALSREVRAIADGLHETRARLEAAIDFPDDLPGDELVARSAAAIAGIHAALDRLLQSAARGARLGVGTAVTIVGAPNVGKSTLLNHLARRERAIVSDVPGTTRDVLEVDVELDGLWFRLSDTAGLHHSAETVELEGMRRTRASLAAADMVMLVVDDGEQQPPATRLAKLELTVAAGTPLLVVHNKTDLRATPPSLYRAEEAVCVHLSARHGQGLELLEQALVEAAALDGADSDEFSARGRHLDALRRARHELDALEPALLRTAPELVAEQCRRAERALGEILGQLTTEDLLGTIFARFCLGK